MTLRTNLKIFYFSYYSLVVYLLMLFPMQLQKIYTTSEIGIIVGSITFFKFLSLYIFGKFSFSRKSIFILNNLFILSIILIYIFQNSFYLLLLFSTIFGVINNFIISYFDQIKINTYRKYLGLFRVFGSFGGLFLFIAIVFLPSLINNMSFLFYFYILGYFIFSNTILYQRKKILKLDIKENSDSNFNYTSAKAYWNIGGIIMIVMSFFHAFIGIYLKEFGYSTIDTSILLSVGIFFEIVAFFCAHILFKIFDYKKLFFLASLITGFRLIFFDVFINSFTLLAITQALHFFTFGIFYASFMNILKTIYKEDINKALQIYNGYIDGIIKSIFIFILAFFLYHGIFLICGLIIVISCIYYKKDVLIS